MSEIAHFNKEITIFGFNPEDIKDLAVTLKRNNIPFSLHIPKEAYKEVKPEEEIDALLKALPKEKKNGAHQPQKIMYLSLTHLLELLLSMIVTEVTKKLIKIIID